MKPPARPRHRLTYCRVCFRDSWRGWLCGRWSCTLIVSGAAFVAGLCLAGAYVAWFT